MSGTVPHEIKSELDSAALEICRWFTSNDNCKVRFSCQIGTGTSVGDEATISANDLKISQSGDVQIRLINGVIGSPSGIEIPTKNNSYKSRITSHKVSVKQLTWTEEFPEPRMYGGVRRFNFVLL